MANVKDLEALTAIVSALQDMDSDSQKRILKAVVTFLDLENMTVEPSQPRLVHTIPFENVVDNSKATNFSDRRTLSVKDFIRDKMPRTDVERVACLGYYLTHYRDMPHFKTADISTINTEAAQPKFSNAAYSVDNATKSGLLVPAIKGAKQLSSMGEMFVQALPNRDESRDVLNNMRLRKRTKKPTKKNNGSESPSSDPQNSSADA